MKKILFTGARSGIAASVIEKLILEDFFIYVTVHTLKEEEAVRKCYSDFKNVECFKLDVTDSRDRKALEKLDIDILVLNAAIGYGGSLLDISVDKFRENFEVNYFSNLEIVQIVLKKMIEKDSGKIIFMSSLAGTIPIEFLGSYCSTKASILMISKVLRKELNIIRANILIKVVEPGIYKTGFNEVMLENKDLKNSKYFSKKKEFIHFKEYLLFDVMGKNELCSIRDKIIKAIKSDSKRFIYSAPISQKVMSKIYQIFWNK